MRNWIDFSEQAPSRRGMLGLLGGAAVLDAMPGAAWAQREPSVDAVLNDPDNPVFGNPQGDIAIVEWFDFNCPYCRKIEPELRQVVQDDGKLRLVIKDWPILGPVSVTASRIALASKFQGKYDKAHDALIGVSSRLTEPRIYELIGGAGVDVDRVKKDLATNAKAIDGMLARNNDTAEALGFHGTPSFIVGKFRVPGVLTIDQFEQVIADARKAKADKG
jgi:protein-disulfide isomerase